MFEAIGTPRTESDGADRKQNDKDDMMDNTDDRTKGKKPFYEDIISRRGKAEKPKRDRAPADRETAGRTRPDRPRGERDPADRAGTDRARPGRTRPDGERYPRAEGERRPRDAHY